MTKNYSVNTLSDLQLDLKMPCVIFLYWDLGAGKTTLSQVLIKKILWKDYGVTSPTYVYYNKYEDVYHFDLYRLWDYDEFVSIWWEEILDQNQGIILVEWPELIKPYYKADIEIKISKTTDDDTRAISVEYN